MKRAIILALIVLLPVWYLTYYSWLESHTNKVILTLDKIIVTPDDVH